MKQQTKVKFSTMNNRIDNHRLGSIKSLQMKQLENLTLTITPVKNEIHKTYDTGHVIRRHLTWVQPCYFVDVLSRC